MMLVCDNYSKLDGEEIGFRLDDIEKSFGIKFGDEDFLQVETYGQFLDVFCGKLSGTSTFDCTSQQAFYKLRNAICATLALEKSIITPNTQLHVILKRETRIAAVKKIESMLAMDLEILRAPYMLTILLVLTFILSLTLLFSSFLLAVFGLLFSYLGIKISKKYGKELRVETVGQVAELMAKFNYGKSRIVNGTYNLKEAEDIVADILGLDKTKISRDAIFV